jgi:hypothetical protein
VPPNTTANEVVDEEEIVLEWPSKRRSRINQTVRRTAGADGISIGVLSERNFGPGFRIVTNAILRAYESRADPKATMLELIELAKSAVSSADGEHFDAPEDAPLISACVEALRQVPTATMWEYLWSLARHSASLEHGVPRAVVAVASADASFKAQFLGIASEVVKNAVINPGRRATSSERNRAQQLREEWKKKPSLSSLWWGLIERNPFLFGRDDDGVLAMVADLDIDLFVRLLEAFDNPYPIAAALDDARVRWSFNRWQDLLSVAPVAFDDERRWNGSPIVPLLLFIGREQLQNRPGPNASETDLKAAADEIGSLTGEIAKVVAGRADAAPCAERWATWLMRGAMTGLSNELLPYPTDARSRGYVDAALIDALTREIPPAGWSAQSSSDAEPWEPWCHRCVLACVAIARATPMPPAEDFLGEWVLSPEDWASEHGRSLKEHASLFETFGKRADAYGTRLLALPLVENSNPESVWKQFWDSTNVIREIIEFGDADGERDEGWRGRSEASGLMRLAFGLGLMMMDHVIAPSRQLPYDRRSALEGLLGALTSAVREMAAIDQLDRRHWSAAARHLAIRRAVWLAKRAPETSPTEVAFDDGTTPALADYIRDLTGNVEDLLALVEVALRNGVDSKTLKQALIKAGINLQADIDLAERLLKLDPKRAGISSEQISSACALLDQAI